MLRTVVGVVAGFFGWVILWFGIEQTLSAAFPLWYGAHQSAFQAAVESGGEFIPETRLLISHLVIGSIVSVTAGFLAAAVAGENQRAPLILGFLLLALGLAKAAMSWSLVPVWYHVGFTALLLPMAILGGRLRFAA